MTVLDRFFGELQALQAQTALDSLTNVGTDTSAYAFGRAVGRLEGLRLAKELLDKLLQEQETKERGVSGRSRGASKAESGRD